MQISTNCNYNCPYLTTTVYKTRTWLNIITASLNVSLNFVQGLVKHHAQEHCTYYDNTTLSKFWRIYKIIQSARFSVVTAVNLVQNFKLR